MKQLSAKVKLLGNGFFNFYLVGHERAAVVECGTRAAARMAVMNHVIKRAKARH